MSKRIGIINCVKTKRELKANETVLAKDLYQGAYMEYMYWYMKNVIKPDLIFFVSAYIPNFSFEPALTKEYKDEYFDMSRIQSFMVEDMQMHSYDTNSLGNWSKPVTKELLDIKSDEWIKEWDIDVENDIIYSFTSKYYRIGYEHKFKNFHQILPKDGFARRLEILKHVQQLYYETEGCDCIENISGND